MTEKLSIALLAACLVALAAACEKGSSSDGGGGGTQTASGDAAHGQQLFTTTCATCHGVDGTGVKGLGKNLTTSEFVHKSSADQLVAMVMKGRDQKDPLNSTGIAMPPKGGNPALSDKDIQDVVAFVKTLKPSG
jgi:mono/diheme cytochrome c family protein